jgi:NLR family CARD domain-containing protein 3
MLSTTSLVGPTVPTWLEEICQKLVENDGTYRTVEMIHPRIDDISANVLAKALSENNSVTAFVLSCYALVDDGAHAIGSVLAEHPCISRLQLRDLRDSREIIIFFSLLTKNKRITDLSMRHCTICPRGARAMADFLRNNTTIQEFRLTDSQLTGNALQILCESGLKYNTSIQRLYLINDDLMGIDSAEHLSAIVNGVCQVEELYLGENNLEDSGVAILSNAIIQKGPESTLSVLDVRSNNLTATGALSMQGLIVNGSNLKTLIISNNELGDNGVMAIARGLQQSSKGSLEKLDVNANIISSVGAVALAMMLRMNKSLSELNLSYNNIGDEGAVAIAAALQVNKTLRCLSLRRNGIGNNGVQKIAESLPHMSALKELILSKNHINQMGALALLRGLRSNVHLEYLNIEEKVSDSVVLREIVHWMRLNKAGRRIFRSRNTVPRPLWSYVYGRISDDSDMVSYEILFCFYYSFTNCQYYCSFFAVVSFSDRITGHPAPEWLWQRLQS